MALSVAELNPTSNLAEISVRFVGELTSVVRDRSGEVIEGKPNETRRQKDIWTFARVMGSDDPNWQLVATDA
jgi:predicted lipid-binding transport protein (Tim44 family)